MATNTATTPQKLSGLAAKLVKDKILTQTSAENAVEESSKKGMQLVQYLVKNTQVKSRDIALSASKEFGVPVLDLDAIEINDELTKLVSKKLQEKHRTIPLFKRGNRLFLAVSDPSDHRGLNEISFSVKLATQLILVEEDKLSKRLDKGSEDSTKFRDVTNDELLGEIQYSSDDEEGAAAAKDKAAIEDAPIVRYINKILV